jgi:hypothetical protein
MAAANASARGQRLAILGSPLHELAGFYLSVDCLTAGCGGERPYAVAELAIAPQIRRPSKTAIAPAVQITIGNSIIGPPHPNARTMATRIVGDLAPMNVPGMAIGLSRSYAAFGLGVTAFSFW